MRVRVDYPSEVLYQIRPFSNVPELWIPSLLSGSDYDIITKNSSFGMFIHSGPVTPFTRIESSGSTGKLFNATSRTIITYPDLLFTGTGTFKFGYVFEYNGTCWFNKSNKEITTKPVSSLIYEYPMTWIGMGLMIISFALLSILAAFCRFKTEKTDTLLGKDTSYHTATYHRLPNKFRWIFHMSREELVRAIGEESYFLYFFRLTIFMCMIVLFLVNFLVLMPLDGVSGSEGDLARFSPASLPFGSNFMYGHLAVMIFLVCLLLAFGFISRLVIPALKTRSIFASDFTVKFSGVHDFEAFKEFLITQYEKESFQSIYPVFDLNYFGDAVKKDESDESLEKLRPKSRFTGIVYATFNHTSLAINCLSKKETFKDITMEKAEEPDDIIWRNQPISTKERWTRIFVLTVISVILILLIYNITLVLTLMRLASVYATGAMRSGLNILINMVTNSDEVSQLLTRIIFIVTSFIPTLIAFSNDVFFILLQKTSVLEGHSSRSGYYTSLFFKIIIVIYINTFLLQLTPYYDIVVVSKSPMRYHFYYNNIQVTIINYLLSQTFLCRAIAYIMEIVGLLMDFLLQIPFWSYLGRFACICSPQKKSMKSYVKEFAFTRPAFSHIYSYALSLNVLYMMFLFSTVVPLIIPFGLLYFAVSLFTDRALLILLYRKGRNLNNYHLMRKTTYVLLFYLLCYLSIQYGYFSFVIQGLLVSGILGGIMLCSQCGILVSCCVLCCIPRWRKIKELSLDGRELDEVYKQPHYQKFIEPQQTN